MKKFLFSSLVLLSFTSAIAGGGWVMPKGTGYFKFNQSAIFADRFFSRMSESVDITGFSLYTSSLYGEYGVTDRLTVIGYFPFLVRSVLNKEVSANTGATLNEGDAYTGIGDMQVGLKYGLLTNSKVVVATSLYLGIPSGATGKGDTRLLQTGDGEFNQMLQLDASSSSKGFFYGLRVGLNNRTSGFSEEFRYGAEFGYSKDKLTLIAKFDGIQSLMNGETNTTGGGSIFSNNLEYNAVILEAGYKITSSWGIGASVFIPFSGRNVLDAPNWNASIFYELKKS